MIEEEDGGCRSGRKNGRKRRMRRRKSWRKIYIPRNHNKTQLNGDKYLKDKKGRKQQ